MSNTETPAPTSQETSSSTPSQPINVEPSDATTQPIAQNTPSQQADAAKAGAENGAADQKADEGDLLFGKDKQVDAVKPTPDEQKQYLIDKKIDIEGKTDEEIAQLFEDAKAADAKTEDAENAIQYDEFDLSKAPDGVEIADDQLEWLKKYGAENNLTQEQAQALVDKGIEMQQKNLDFWNDTKKAWRDQVKNDPVLGGHNLVKSVAAAESVIAKFGGTPENIKELQDDLQLLGLGNKRSFIHLLCNISKATSEDRADTPSGNNTPEQKSLAQRMWGNMPGDKK